MKTFLATICSLVLACSVAVAGTDQLPRATLLISAAAPSNGTNEIQTLTFGSGITGGTFTLNFGRTTSSIAWSATNATLVANIDAALEALTKIGASGVTTAVGTMTAGIGTITVTFTGKNAKLDVPLMTVPTNALTPTSTLTIATTTPGVTADGRSSAANTLCYDAADQRIYSNTGTSPNPTWTQILPVP